MYLSLLDPCWSMFTARQVNKQKISIDQWSFVIILFKYPKYFVIKMAKQNDYCDPQGLQLWTILVTWKVPGLLHCGGGSTQVVSLTAFSQFFFLTASLRPWIQNFAPEHSWELLITKIAEIVNISIIMRFLATCSPFVYQFVCFMTDLKPSNN